MAYDFNSLTKQAAEATNRDKFYTDFEDVDTTVLHQISELTEWMRTKAKGSDVREVIAQLFERTWVEGIKEGNANMEVAKARGYFRTLAEHLSAIDEKATTRLDAIVSGSPKKVFATLGELQSNFPKGAEGVFVVSENGHWYYWNGSVWEDGGAYQSAVLADYQKGSYLKRVLDKLKKVQSNFKILTISEETGPLYESTTFSNDSVKVASGGYFFPKIGLNDAQDVFVTLYNVNYPNRIKIGIKAADNSLIKSFDLKGASADKIYYIDLNDYLGVTSEIGAHIEIRVDNRNQPDILTIDKFLVGKGGIPVSKEDSVLSDDINIIKRVANANLVKTNINLLDDSNSSQSRISGSKITVEPGGFYFPAIAMNKAKDIYITLHGVNHPERITARIKRGWDGVIEPFDLPGSVADDVYYLNLNDYMDVVGAQPDDEFEIRVDNRNQSDNLTIEKFLVGKGGIPTDLFSIQNQKEVYVDATVTLKGDGTASSPFKTIQEALNVRAETILVAPGIYNESLTATNYGNLTIRSLSESDYNPNTKTDVKAVTISPTTKLNLSADDTILSSTITAGTSSRLYKTFISKTMPLIDSGTRSDGYNVTVWEITGNITTEKRLVPVATQSECKAKTGTFTFDGTKIWINPFDGISENKEYLMLNDADYCANFSNIQHLSLSGLKFIGGYSNAVRMDKVIKFDFVRVEASRSALGNGFSCDNSNGTFTSCTANQNRNDGFNFHGFGDTHLIDCEGHYNFDDGNSHHDGCTGTIVRGEWSHNGKGGCSPTYGSIIHIDGVYTHHNQYGFYCDILANNPSRTVRHSNCIAKDNSIADYLIGAKYTVLGMSNLFTTKTGGGEYIQLK